MTILIEEPPETVRATRAGWRQAVRVAGASIMKPIQAIARFAYDLLRDLF